MIGGSWGVQWCVVGVDRNWAYNPDCKMAQALRAGRHDSAAETPVLGFLAFRLCGDLAPVRSTD